MKNPTSASMLLGLTPPMPGQERMPHKTEPELFAPAAGREKNWILLWLMLAAAGFHNLWTGCTNLYIYNVIYIYTYVWMCVCRCICTHEKYVYLYGQEVGAAQVVLYNILDYLFFIVYIRMYIYICIYIYILCKYYCTAKTIKHFYGLQLMQICTYRSIEHIVR